MRSDARSSCPWRIQWGCVLAAGALVLSGSVLCRWHQKQHSPTILRCTCSRTCWSPSGGGAPLGKMNQNPGSLKTSVRRGYHWHLQCFELYSCWNMGCKICKGRLLYWNKVYYKFCHTHPSWLRILMYHDVSLISQEKSTCFGLVTVPRVRLAPCLFVYQRLAMCLEATLTASMFPTATVISLIMARFACLICLFEGCSPFHSNSSETW